VHATRHAQLTRSEDITDAIFMAGDAVVLEPRDQAIYDFAMQLSRTPSTASAEQIDALRAAGLDDLDILDLVLSASLFGWANRLMHVLGDPVKQDTTS